MSKKVTEHTQPSLLIVTGLPCSGKTTLAHFFATQLDLPLVTKDGIKEQLFDSLGWSDRQWSRRLGEATYALMFHFIESLIAARLSLIAESNFPPGPTSTNIARLQEKYSFNLIAVECIARADILEYRWRRRAEKATRHPGHNDSNALDEFLQMTRDHTDADGYGRLGIPPGALSLGVVDTSAKPEDLQPLVERIRSSLGSN